MKDVRNIVDEPSRLIETKRDASSTIVDEPSRLIETKRDASSTIATKRDASFTIATQRDASFTIATKRDASFTIATKRDASFTMPFNYFNPSESIANLSGNLPHWRQQGTTYFVTFRLADSLPQAKLDQWLKDRDDWMSAHPEPHDPETIAEYYRLFPEKLQNWLDACYGSCVLAQPLVKKIVENALKHFDGKRYRMIEYVVMPNHVHALVAPSGEHSLSAILHSWKSFTAHEIMKVDEAARLVSRQAGTRQVWQRESFDHIVRSADQMTRIRQYIRDNPTVLTKRRIEG